MARAKSTEAEVAARKKSVLQAARWCFLNFGFAKTSFEDIAKRANLSRTLLYRLFKNKEDIFTAVFADLLISRHPEAIRISAASASRYDRLVDVCRIIALEPWAEMLKAPMGGEFFDVCARLDPEVDAMHRKVALQCVTAIVGDVESAEVFLLALDGLLADEPSIEQLDRRTKILIANFVSSEKTRKRKDL